MIKFWINALIVTLLVAVTAQARIINKRDANVNKVCPAGSTGEHPNCVCDNGSKFNEIHQICPPQSLESFSGSCPNNSAGVFPNCVCQEGKRYDHKHSICLEVDRSKCPKRSVGTVPHCKCEEGYKLDNVHWYCRAWYLNDTEGGFNIGPVPQCPVYSLWDGKKCEPIRCPNDRTLLYPHCITSYDPVRPRLHCPTGQNYTIEKPYCHCPNDQEYTYPICHERCELNTYFEVKSNSCIRRPCPTGWLGDYYPHCSLASFRKCPGEFPGEWPNCNIYDQGPRLDELKQRLNNYIY